MNGVYIKGIQKPSQCGECKICNWIPIGEFDLLLKCPLLERKVGFATRREDCPLIPVPDHGRLIDADAYENILRSLGSRDYRREKGTICDAIKFLHEHYAPTIIPADKEGEA